MNILHINSSIFGDNGQSSQLAAQVVARLQALNAGASVVKRDVVAEAMPHLDGVRMGALMTPAEQRSAEQQAVVDFSDALIAELQAADAIVFGVPMYNFTIPSQLKSYFDHVARAGVTFRYTDTGPEGLLKGKKVYVCGARGGRYLGTEADTQTGYLKVMLGFMGLNDVQFVFAEGLNMGDDSRTASLSAAQASIASVN